MELMVSVWPQIDWRSENFKEMRQKGLLVQTEHGLNVQMDFQGNNVFYDATNLRPGEYVWEKCRKNYRENGIKLFWLDEAEPEYTTYDYETTVTMPEASCSRETFTPENTPAASMKARKQPARRTF